MQRVRFTYSTPMIGEFENDGPDMDDAEIINTIARDYPEAVDIDILEVEETTSG